MLVNKDRESEVAIMRMELLNLVEKQFSAWTSNTMSQFVEQLIAHGKTGTVEEFVKQDGERLDKSAENAMAAIDRITKMSEEEVRKLYYKKFGTTTV